MAEEILDNSRAAIGSEITNPYRPGEPVVDPAMLFGRQDAADWVEAQLSAGTRVLVLSGQPLIGKTSFIKHVGALQVGAAINLSVVTPALWFAPPAPPDRRQRGRAVEPGETTVTIDKVLQQILEQLLPQLKALHLLSVQSSTPPPTPSALRELFVQMMPAVSGQPVVLYVDDLHHLVTTDLSLLATFLSTFIPILDECPNLHLVFAINSDKLKSIRHPVLDSAPTFHLAPLPLDASANMITLPVKNILRFDYGITRRIAEINSHHPYYLALFCHTLLNRQVHDGWVNQRDFDAVLSEVLASPIEPFTRIWDESSWVERAVLSSMAAMQGKHGPMMQQEVIRALQGKDSSTVQDVVIDSLKSLAERGVLVPMGAVSYRFHVELLRFWLREHTDPVEILKEVEWARLAAQAKLNRKEDRAITPPIATRRSAKPARRGFLWPILLGFAAVLCLFTTGAVFAFQVLDLPLDFFTTPTAAPLVSAPVAGEDSSPVTAEEPVAPSPTAPPAPPTPTPALVIARTLPSITYMAKDVGQSWRIYTMNADGTENTALTEEGLDNTAPIWSTDGRRVAYVSQRDGDREIYVMDIETKEEVNVTRHPADDWTPAWSPDGSRLAFASLRAGNWEIFVVDLVCLDTPEICPDNTRQITADGNGNISPVWSPDGARFAYTSKANGNWDIFTMTIDGSDIRQITTAVENDLSPAWSPDGSMLAFESSREGNVEIYIADSNGQTPARNVTNLAFADDHGPTWSPDGQSVVFYSNREGNWDLFSTTLDGQTVVNLTQTPTRDEQTPAWRP